MAVPVDKWQHVQLVVSKHGPSSQSLRLVLLAISAEISSSQYEAWPSQERIAERCQLSERQVKRLVKDAQETGWLRRRWGRKQGAAWRYTIYTLVVPDALLHAVPEHPWDTDREWKRGDKAAARSSEQGDKLLTRCRPDAGPETVGERDPSASNVPSGASKVPSKGSNVPNTPGSKVPSEGSKVPSRWPTTFPSDVPSNVPPHAPLHGAQRTARVNGGISESDPEIQRRRRQAAEMAELSTRKAAAS